jgi:hypothetical protein
MGQLILGRLSDKKDSLNFQDSGFQLSECKTGLRAAILGILFKNYKRNGRVPEHQLFSGNLGVILVRFLPFW